MLDCPEEMHLSDEVCLGTSLMLRMSFALCCFHILMFLMILARNDMVAAIHDGCWGTKFGLVCLLYTASFWYGNDFFLIGYLNLTKWVGTMFLIYQALLMLIVAYKINEQLVSNAVNDTTNCSGIILILMTLIYTSGNGYWMVQ